MSIVIKIEDVSKVYRLGQFNTGALSKDLERWWAMVRGKDDPFLKIGERNDRTVTSDSNVVWSLRDINLEVDQGDAIGIIGKNGAGKSTLLKVLSRVTSPTTGKIRIKGRVASLLEVGTGFHPELTGRENIYLNGAILGMRKNEIKRRFDEIVAFAGVEKYVNTPVKRYSSGMYVRLAFAVAAHLESEILIVDEVLAVGDAEFQRKCIGKMQDIQGSEGRTILFVSHNMSAVRSLCNKSLILKNGELTALGDVNELVDQYLEEETIPSSKVNFNQSNKDRRGARSFARFTEIELRNEKEQEANVFYKGSSLKVLVSLETSYEVNDVEIGFGILNSAGTAISGQVSTWDHRKISLDQGTHTISGTINEINLVPGKYSITVWIKNYGMPADDQVNNAISFLVEEETDNDRFVGFEGYQHLNSHQKCEWNILD